MNSSHLMTSLNSYFCFSYLWSPISHLDDRQWHHICLSWENVNGSWVLYSDGSVSDSGTGHKVGSVIDGKGQFSIGNSENPLVGIIGDVNVWDTKLEVQTIQDMYKSKTLLLPNRISLKWCEFENGLQGDVRLVPRIPQRQGE